MTLASDVEDAINEHLKEFVLWMEDGWMMSDKDVEASVINDLPEDPDKAYQMGHNEACKTIQAAYECYVEDN